MRDGNVQERGHGELGAGERHCHRCDGGVSRDTTRDRGSKGVPYCGACGTICGNDQVCAANSCRSYTRCPATPCSTCPCERTAHARRARRPFSVSDGRAVQKPSTFMATFVHESAAIVFLIAESSRRRNHMRRLPIFPAFSMLIVACSGLSEGPIGDLAIGRERGKCAPGSAGGSTRRRRTTRRRRRPTPCRGSSSFQTAARSLLDARGRRPHRVEELSARFPVVTGRTTDAYGPERRGRARVTAQCGSSPSPSSR
jgi:hypothetical protein